jgi:hypothetical protein
VDDVKALMLEFVNAQKNYKKRVPSRSNAGVARAPRSAQATSNVYSQRLGLEDVVVNDFIKDAFIPDGDAQVAVSQISTGVRV